MIVAQLKLLLARFFCDHPVVERHTVGLKPDYEHKECLRCGKEYGYRDNT